MSRTSAVQGVIYSDCLKLNSTEWCPIISSGWLQQCVDPNKETQLASAGRQPPAQASFHTGFPILFHLPHL